MAEQGSGASTGAMSLRQRQKEEVRTAIHLAALELVEEQGLDATTVQQIAERAGVSARTFFRYYATKERAVLVADDVFERRVDDLELSQCRGPGEALELIELMMREFVARDTDPDMAQHRRIMRLLEHQPSFRALVLAQDEALSERLREHLERQAAGVGPVEAAVVAQMALAAWRVGWDLWGRQERSGGGTRPVEHFDEARAAVRGIMGRPASAGG